MKTHPAQIGLSLLALLLLAVAPEAPAGEQEKNEKHRVVIRHLADCPQMELHGTLGEPLHVGRSNRAFLGVEPTSLTPELRQHFGVPGDAGVMVARVVEDSAAAGAGLAVGDIITRIDGEKILSVTGLGRAVRQKSGGEEVAIEYWRGGEAHTATATLGEHERCAVDVGHYLHDIDIEGLAKRGLEIGGEAFEALRDVDWEEALEGLRDIDWEKELEGLKGIDVEGLEKRMEEVQERLRQLEKNLDQEQERLERLERDRERAQGGGDA